MGGAALFTLILIAVLVAGAYLLQLVLWLAYAAVVVAFYVGCLVFSAVWAVLDWRGFRESLAPSGGGACTREIGRVRARRLTG